MGLFQRNELIESRIEPLAVFEEEEEGKDHDQKIRRQEYGVLDETRHFAHKEFADGLGTLQEHTLEISLLDDDPAEQFLDPSGAEGQLHDLLPQPLDAARLNPGRDGDVGGPSLPDEQEAQHDDREDPEDHDSDGQDRSRQRLTPMQEGG